MFTVLCTNALDAALHRLVPRFESEHGRQVAVTFKSTNAIDELVRSGTAADLVIAGRPVIDRLALEGALDSTSVRDIAASGIGVCVRRGAPRPDVSSVAAFRQALLAAESVAYSRNGQSGAHFAALIDQLGIGDAIRAKAKVCSGALIGEVVARGEAAIGVQQISELLAAHGAEFIGALPAEIQKTTVFTAALGAGTRAREAAGAFVRFISTPAAVEIMKETGLDAL